MKNFNVKQSGSEVILEEVNPYPEIIYEEDGCVDSVETAYSMNDRHKFTPLILTSIDPNIKVGQVIREDQLEPDLWQFKDEWGVWLTITWPHYPDLEIRQVAKLKQVVHETPKSGHDLETCTEKEEKPLPNDIDLIKLGELLKYSNKYEISIQFWPDQIAVYIMKDQVDLIDYGGDFDTVVTASINYLKRITKSHENRKDNR